MRQGGRRVIEMGSGFGRKLSRRRFMAAGVAAAGILALGNTACHPAIMRRLRQIESRRYPQHAVWIWQFSFDGPIEALAETLAAHRLSAIVKTHDGVEWMAAYDDAPDAIAGPESVARAASAFEGAGVPFHAWSVVTGADPSRESEMAAQVLDAGARSLTLDLEEGAGFWHGTREDARRFGDELRARHEYARIDISIDPRPWKWFHIPLLEFVDFTDGIRPQLYWDLFDDAEHARAYEYMGFPPPAEGITPEFITETTHTLLAPYDRWIVPVGPGTTASLDEWSRFLRRCTELQMPAVSLWRYGITAPEVLQLLSTNPPPQS